MIDHLLLVLLVIFALVRSTYGISGGIKATTLEFSFAAQINKGCEYISGAIIHQCFVITMAAHVYHLREVEPIPTKLLRVIVGHDRTSEIGTQYSAQKIIYHPEYNKNFKFKPNDVALIKLMNPIQFTDRIQPVPLAEVNPPSGKKGWVASYGYATKTEQWSDEHFLRAAQVTLVNYEHFDDYVISTKPEERVGICPGDAGAPFVINGKLVGIDVIHEGECEEETWMGYVSIADQRKWIEKTIKGNT